MAGYRASLEGIPQSALTFQLQLQVLHAGDRNIGSGGHQPRAFWRARQHEVAFVLAQLHYAQRMDQDTSITVQMRSLRARHCCMTPLLHRDMLLTDALADRFLESLHKNS